MALIQVVAAGLLALGSYLVIRYVILADALDAAPDRRIAPGPRDQSPETETRWRPAA